MKKAELVYRDILYRVIENKEFRFTQLELGKRLNISLSIVNSAIKRLEGLGAIRILRRSFSIIDLKKILYYWASVRNLRKDIVFKERVEMPVRDIERNMPSGIVCTAYSAYKFRFRDVPADYSEIYVYADEGELELMKKRFNLVDEHKRKLVSSRPNLFLLKKDSLMNSYSSIPLAQVFVDLWNLPEWYAKEFVQALEKRIFEEAS